MNIRELIDQLEDIAASYPEAEIRLASQPAWPFENEIANVTLVEMTDDNGENGQPTDVEMLVYITEGRQVGYLPPAACQEIGWK